MVWVDGGFRFVLNCEKGFNGVKNQFRKIQIEFKRNKHIRRIYIQLHSRLIYLITRIDHKHREISDLKFILKMQ